MSQNINNVGNQPNQIFLSQSGQVANNVNVSVPGVTGNQTAKILVQQHPSQQQGIQLSQQNMVQASVLQNNSTTVPLSSPTVKSKIPEAQVLDKKRVGELVKEVDPQEQLDEEVEDLLLQIADDFIEQIVSSACSLARHRKAASVEVKDVQLVLEKNHNMWIPGFGTEDVRPYKRSSAAEAHKQRMTLIRKALKKY